MPPELGFSLRKQGDIVNLDGSDGGSVGKATQVEVVTPAGREKYKGLEQSVQKEIDLEDKIVEEMGSYAEECGGEPDEISGMCWVEALRMEEG